MQPIHNKAIHIVMTGMELAWWRDIWNGNLHHLMLLVFQIIKYFEFKIIPKLLSKVSKSRWHLSKSPDKKWWSNVRDLFPMSPISAFSAVPAYRSALCLHCVTYQNSHHCYHITTSDNHRARARVRRDSEIDLGGSPQEPTGTNRSNSG